MGRSTTLLALASLLQTLTREQCVRHAPPVFPNLSVCEDSIVAEVQSVFADVTKREVPLMFCTQLPNLNLLKGILGDTLGIQTFPPKESVSWILISPKAVLKTS